MVLTEIADSSFHNSCLEGGRVGEGWEIRLIYKVNIPSQMIDSRLGFWQKIREYTKQNYPEVRLLDRIIGIKSIVISGGWSYCQK